MALQPLLSVPPLDIPSGAIVLSTPGFQVNRGDVLHVVSGPEARTTEWLFVISGLYDAFAPTAPADRGRIVRTPVAVSLEEVKGIEFDGAPLYERPKEDRARDIGFVFRESDLGIVGRTVEEDFLHATLPTGKLGQRALVASRLVRYGLAGKLARPTHVLSDGEKQRLNCATALERFPRLVVLDFTATNLDHDFVLDLISWLRQYAESGNAVIIAGLSDDEIDLLGGRRLDVQRGMLGECAVVTTDRLSAARQASALQAALEARTLGDTVLVATNVAWKDRTLPLSFELKSGEIAVLRGNNGTGKTTLASILGGRIPKREVTGQFTDHRESGVSIAFQSPRRTLLSSDIAAEVGDPELLRACGFSESGLRDPLALPYSQQKLLGCAVAIALAKKVVILDEPTAGMDFETKVRLVQLLNLRKNLAVLIISHDMALNGVGTSAFQMGAV